MIKLINNELSKVKKRKIVFIELLFIITLILMNKYGKSSLSILSFNLIPFIGVVSSILFSGSICFEIESGTMRYYLTKPYKRWKIYLSKLITIILFVIISILIIVIVTTILENSFDKEYIIKYFKYSVPIIFLSSFILFLSTKYKSQVFVSCTSILTLCFSLMLSQILFGINITFIEYSFLPYLDFTIFEDPMLISDINSTLNVHLSLNKGIIIDMLSTIIFCLFGIYRFNKKDIKN